MMPRPRPTGQMVRVRHAMSRKTNRLIATRGRQPELPHPAILPSPWAQRFSFLIGSCASAWLKEKPSEASGNQNVPSRSGRLHRSHDATRSTSNSLFVNMQLLLPLYISLQTWLNRLSDCPPFAFVFPVTRKNSTQKAETAQRHQDSSSQQISSIPSTATRCSSARNQNVQHI